MKAALILLLAATPVLADPTELCQRVQAEAEANALPPLTLARLIAAVSGFEPGFRAPEPTGRARLTNRGPRAQGIAGLPAPRLRRLGLDDPFDTPAAIATAARHLSILSRQHGNLGLAIAAYDQDDWRVSSYLAGGDPLPARAVARVQAVTGHRLDDWRDTDWPPPATADFITDCVALATPAPVERPPAQLWAVILSTGADAALADSQAADWTTRLAPALGGAKVEAQPIRLRGRADPTLSIQIGTANQARAVALCNRLKAADVSCMVLKNDPPSPAPLPP